jgi:hypothetical protein
MYEKSAPAQEETLFVASGARQLPPVQLSRLRCLVSAAPPTRQPRTGEQKKLPQKLPKKLPKTYPKNFLIKSPKNFLENT